MSSGVPRKTQTYNQARTFMTGLRDNRMTASRMPSTEEMSMATIVSTRVSTTPLRIRGLKMYSLIVG